jgi:hypothetical protein
MSKHPKHKSSRPSTNTADATADANANADADVFDIFTADINAIRQQVKKIRTLSAEEVFAGASAKARRANLPTLLDISPTNGTDFDEQQMLYLFLGKTQEEVTKYFFRYPGLFTMEFLKMGKKGLAFYFPSVMKYIRSEKSTGDTLTFASLIITIVQRLEHEPASILLARESVLDFLGYCLEHYPKNGS